LHVRVDQDAWNEKVAANWYPLLVGTDAQNLYVPAPQTFPDYVKVPSASVTIITA